MIDYDEMNRVLTESEKQLAIEEAQRQREWEMFDPEPGDPDDGDEDGGDYEIAKAQVEMVKATLERRTESARKDHDSLVNTEKSLRQDMLLLIVRFCLHLGGYPVLYGILYESGEATLKISGTVAGGAWVLGTILFLVILLDGITYYAVMQTTSRAVPFIEAKRILTIEKMRDHALTRIRYAKERMDRVDVLDRKLERERYLEKADMEELAALGTPYVVTCPYRERKVTFGEYLWFRIKGNKMT